MARPENPIEYTSTDELYRGSRIRELRREKGLSREKMASLLGCHPDSLSNVEANAVNPSNKLLSKIANVLEAPLEYFTQAPVHPRILSKKEAQAVVQPQVVSPLASCQSTTLQSSREAVLKLLEAAGVTSDEDLKGFALVKIKEEEEDQGRAIPAYSAGNPGISIRSLPSSTRWGKIERLIASGRFSEEEEQEVEAAIIEIIKRFISFKETKRKMREEG